tara:strand:- start:40 stop:759 length:720 start_codon:yes stop_codon:yes gene_type:complete
MKKNNLDKYWEKIFTNWQVIEEFEKDYMIDLSSYLKKQKLNKKIIYPNGNKIFNAFKLTKFEDVKVVILGQDPYHGPGQANGLSFSVENGVKKPPSLQNIFKELNNDLEFKISSNGNLEKWSKQGVLLLNSILTVEKGKPGSHANKGWEKFTDQVLFKLNFHKEKLVYILWGKKAQDKANFINNDKNLIIKSSHPSPYSAHSGFFGSKPFSSTNKYLRQSNNSIIDWNLNSEITNTKIK